MHQDYKEVDNIYIEEMNKQLQQAITSLLHFQLDV